MEDPCGLPFYESDEGKKSANCTTWTVELETRTEQYLLQVLYKYVDSCPEVDEHTVLILMSSDGSNGVLSVFLVRK